MAMAADFVVRHMSRKELSASDISEGRVYLPTELVQNLGRADGTERVTVFDVQMNPSTMNFCRRRDQRAFLGDGWRQFVIEKGFTKDDTVIFYVLRPRGGGINPTYFQIIRREDEGRAIGQFDLNRELQF
ncbi:hypothetical protein FH972_019271 [Carpinus fangiana]|uniref:TF-B3 domain-containing protein n=1 Tax=Carpinus fangiana TaxID=176857 RepID=A0A5N6RR43_9ROSI|nr:hypothetical protein FH972_019271 [Carpinus fangiana]